jgi:hypothetical protein
VLSAPLLGQVGVPDITELSLLFVLDLLVGVSPLVLGAFGGSSALMGILATFMTPSLVKELGILKAGAAGLLAQSTLLGAAVLVYLSGSICRQGALFIFLGLIVSPIDERENCDVSFGACGRL